MMMIMVFMMMMMMMCVEGSVKEDLQFKLVFGLKLCVCVRGGSTCVRALLITSAGGSTPLYVLVLVLVHFAINRCVLVRVLHSQTGRPTVRQRDRHTDRLSFRLTHYICSRIQIDRDLQK